jgi:hypothetical protein
MNFSGSRSKGGSADIPEIDFRATDWFDKYIAYRKRHPIAPDTFDPEDFGVESDGLQLFESVHHPLYLMLLHSGLVYGFPFIYPFKPAPAEKLKQRWVTKLTLIDITIYSVLKRLSGEHAMKLSFEEKLDRASQVLRLYYRGLQQHAGGLPRSSIEHVLSHHISFRRNWMDWRRSGINCHLFWDWYYFLYFLEALEGGAAPSAALFEDLIAKRKAMKMLTMQLIAAAAHSDQKIQLGERVLQHHFQKSSHFFTSLEQAKIKKIFREGVDLENLRLPRMNWVVRRYWLDISLMTVFADKEIQEAEEQYLQRLLKKLELNEKDLLESKLALGGFLLRFGKRLPFFNSQKASIHMMSKALAENMHNIRQATRGEFRETVEMAITFGRLLQHQLGIGKGKKLPSEEEIAQALDQMKDLPKFLPFFSIMFLPVPGITEMYIVLAYTIERLSRDNLRLLPSRFSKMVRGK